MLLIVLDSEMRFSLSKLDTLIFPNQRCSWKVETRVHLSPLHSCIFNYLEGLDLFSRTMGCSYPKVALKIKVVFSATGRHRPSFQKQVGEARR